MMMGHITDHTCCTGLLWTVTPKLVWFLFVYAGVGTYVTTSAFGKRLMQLHFATVQREGDLRFDMVRTRENAGKISHLLRNLDC